ncbi:MAG: hypothetical protein AB8B53_07810 [Flavobacteriales bacterium]
MKSLFITLSLICLTISSVFCQIDTAKFNAFKQKLVFDGNISAQFGTVNTIGATPQIGYQFTDKLVAGIGYTYNSSSYSFLGERTSTRSHGPTLFGRYLINPNIFVRSEFHSIKTVFDSFGEFTPASVRDERFFIGGGYRYELTPKIHATAGVFLDILESNTRPQFRGGIEARL